MTTMIRKLAIVLSGLLACASPAFCDERAPGVQLRLFEVDEALDQACPLVAGQTPNVDKVVARVDLDAANGDFAGVKAPFVAELQANLVLKKAGVCRFKLECQDGAILSLDDQVDCLHDGVHEFSAKEFERDMIAGNWNLQIRLFDSGTHESGARIRLWWKPAGADDFEIVPASALSCTAGEVRVTSPGPKRVMAPSRKPVPGDRCPLVAVHPSWDLATIRPAGFEPKVGGMDFLPDGRLAVCTWDSIGAVWLLDGVEGDDLSKVTVTRFAAGLAEPLGLRVVDGVIFVQQKQELTALIDTDDDGVADIYHAVACGWPVTANFHEFTFGLERKDDCFWSCLAIAINPGGKSTNPQIDHRGTVLRIHDDGAFDFFAHGLRTPNTIGKGAFGDLYVADNQGDWVPASKVVHVEDGAFYGSRAVLHEKAAGLKVTPPVVWMPHGEVSNSPSGIVPFRGHDDQMLVGDVTYGGIQRVAVERFGAVMQGSVFRFSQGFEAGVNRMAWGPDGALYVGGVGSTGNWGQEGKQRFGLQRMRPNGKPTFSMLALHAYANGIEIEFSEPLAEGAGWDANDFDVDRFRYEPTDRYGGPKLDGAVMNVTATSVSADRMRVFLAFEGIEANRVYHVRVARTLFAESARPLWTTEGWYTMNVVPERTRAQDARPAFDPNALTAAEVAAGWRALFDGKSTNGWRGYRKDAAPSGWKVIDGALVRPKGADDGGDLVTSEDFADFELEFDWRVEEGGNSGVMYRVGETEDYPWRTGPEYQLLDNRHHGDGKNALTTAASLYALVAPPFDATEDKGRWNRARIVLRGNHVEHWLNGYKTAEAEIDGPAWKEALAKSKFASMPKYATLRSGKIALQDHGDKVEYRRIRVRKPPV